jgi:chromosome partitioning protein
MKVIAVLNQKGGSGKTTISTNLARALQIEGYDVILIDSDPQCSATKWWQLKDEHPLKVFPISKPVIERSIKDIRKVDYIVIDGVPHDNEMATSALKAADFVLIPVTPSVYDIMASRAIVDKVKDRIAITDGRLKTAFVISRAIKNTKLEKNAVDKLNEYELPILETHTYQRVIYPTSAGSGDSVFDENPECEAAKEIKGIMQEVIALLS